jgi:hypothetical protein
MPTIQYRMDTTGTLADLGITSINTNGTNTGPQAGQLIANNRVALSTTFTQNGTAHTVGAIDLEANNFFTEFPPEVVDEAGNPVAITAQAQALPQMNGSGMVRNMRAPRTSCERRADINSVAGHAHKPGLVATFKGQKCHFERLQRSLRAPIQLSENLIFSFEKLGHFYFSGSHAC